MKWRGHVGVDQVLELARDRDSAHEALARELEARARRDAQLLNSRMMWVMACGVLLAAQSVLWSLALIG